MKKASAQICCLPHNYIISSFHKFMARKQEIKKPKKCKKTKTEKQSKVKKKKRRKEEKRRIVYGRKYQKDAG